MKNTVLIVDDNADLVASVSRYLGERGFEVVVSETALGVSALVLRHKPAVVVLDVMMPALDGAALARILREQVGSRKLPIIFYSSMEEEQLYRLTRQTDAATYVLKSDGLKSLHTAICSSIGPRVP